MKRYKYLFFDLDGTLTDSSSGIFRSIQYALDIFGIKTEDAASLNRFLGPPLTWSFTHFLGFDESRAVLGTKYYREYYRKHGIFDNKVYEGIPELLSSLCDFGYRPVLATSKPEPFARQILEHFDLMKYFYFVAGSTMDDSRSAKSDVIRYALASCHIKNPAEVLMIGDREHDILGAKKASEAIDSLGVLYGYGSREELEAAGADFLAETVSDLRDFLIPPHSPNF